MNKWPQFMLNTLGLSIAMVGGASAALQDFDRGPYTLATGRFPMWYQDFNGLKLELCLQKTVSSRSPGTAAAPGFMCTIPAEGGFDPLQPIIFPNNFPGESFWFTADGSVGDRNWGIEQYVAAMEAVAGEGVIVDGEQHNFARIRIRAGVPTAGMYTVRHPYGTKVYVVTAPGRRAINDTSDVGIATLNYAGALNGAIGPFLYTANPNATPLMDGAKEIARYYTETNPETGQVERFIGDPNIEEAVLGSPVLDASGQPQNYLEISGPAGTLRTNTFSISGKIFDDRIQTPVEVERATYQRDGSGSRVELFVNSFRAGPSGQAPVPAASNVCYRDTLTLVGTPPAPCLPSPAGDLRPDNNGYFYTTFTRPGAPPSVVVLTASEAGGANKPTSVSRTPVDVVKISTASYDSANHRLTITATSSDKVLNPVLLAQGFGPLPTSGTLVVEDVPQPPESVIVKSAAGGADSEPVRVVGIAEAPADNQKPLAGADFANTSSGVPITINVLANDSDPDNNNPLAIDSFVPPAAGQGTVALNGTTSLTYTPPVTNVPLVATFTYMAKDSKGLASDPATVTVNVSPNQPPVAVNDAATTLGVPVTIAVLANDTDPESNLPLGLVSVTQPATGLGTVTANADGTVTYNPPANFTGTITPTFTYLVRDSLGAVSVQPGSVTVTVQQRPTANETFTVTTAELQARTNNRWTWEFAGTSSLTNANTITIRVQSTTGLVTLGTTTVPANGRWRFTANNSLVAPGSTLSATISSSFGTTRTVAVTQTR
ncbi:Ig-like domain-containing protein [Pseudomonas schmalbachii]|uniref:Cadherin-like domain-containing protein n=1 Tax=Pseudomonas schmalbachii TaxID=2816993 RepID=A0ABS3TJR8_9PSED|nr:Ig-like domain-containing protein [Pseudomonas schmalbachii]MBO3273902.1 cadherin-like domain-containing protein [Pseudomonas schmalbachii]